MAADPPEFVLRSSKAKASLTLVWRTPEYVTATIESTGLRAETEIYLLQAPLDFAALLLESDDQWRGWDGAKEWRSLEGDLTIAWSHNGLGLVTFKVTLERGFGLDWRTVAIIEVEAGQLGRVATDLRRFCSWR